MNDLVERLRCGTGDGLRAYDWMNEAADCIESQAARIAELEVALRFYADPSKYTDIHGDDVQVPDFYSETDFGETARAALEGEKDEPTSRP